MVLQVNEHVTTTENYTFSWADNLVGGTFIIEKQPQGLFPQMYSKDANISIIVVVKEVS